MANVGTITAPLIDLFPEWDPEDFPPVTHFMGAIYLQASFVSEGTYNEITIGQIWPR